MSVLFRYTLDTLRRNKHTTLSVMAAILLASTLLYAFCSYAYNRWQLELEVTRYQGGNWHGELGGNLSLKDLELADHNLSVEETMVKGPFRCLKLPQPSALPYLIAVDADAAYWREMPEKNRILEGRIPQKPGELAVSKSFFDRNPDYRLGDTLALPKGSRAYGGEDISNDIRRDGETFVRDGEETVTLVGKLDTTTSTTVPGYYAMGYLNRSAIAPDHKLVVYLKMKDVRDTYREMPRIAQTLGIGKDEYGQYEGNFRYNTALLARYGVFDPSAPFQLSNYRNAVVDGILVLLVAVTFVLIIQSAFSLSARSRIRQLGMFRSVGATPGQIRMSIVIEGLLLSAMPILLSVAAGHLFVMATYGLYSHIAGDSLYFPITARFSWKVAALAAILSLASVLVSAFLPARRIATLSPLEAIRAQQMDLRPGSARRLRFLPGCLGIRGQLANASYHARRRSFRSAVVSMSLCLTLVFFFFALMAINDGNSQRIRQMIHYNVFGSIQTAEPMNPALWERLSSVEGILQKAYYCTRPTALWVSSSQELPGFAAGGGLDSLDPSSFSVLKRDGRFRVTAELTGLDHDLFDAYCRQAGADPAAFYDRERPRALALSVAPLHPFSGNPVKSHMTFPFLKLSKGQELALEEKAEDSMDTDYRFTVTVGAVPDRLPQIDYNPTDYRVLLCFPMDVYNSITANFKPEYAAADNRTYLLFQTSPADDLAATAQVRRLCEDTYSSEDAYVYSLEEDRRYSFAATRAMGTVVNCIGGLLALIGISNAFSSVSASMRQRRREFAMLRSVGMDARAVDRLLGLEALRMAAAPMLPSLLLCTLLSAVALHMMEMTWGEFLPRLPYLKIGGYTLAVMGAMVLAYRLSSRRIRKDNIIDAVRDETV